MFCLYSDHVLTGSTVYEQQSEIVKKKFDGKTFIEKLVN